MKELTLRETQLASLEIMKRVHGICEEIGAKYYLVFGTLLGAVRHQGFIPWDDDIDIAMFREDYNLLLNYFETHKNQLYPFEVVNYNTRNKCPYMITRICDTRYKLIRKHGESCEMGVFIDIYPFDNLKGPFETIKRISRKSKEWSSALSKSLQGDYIKYSISTHGFVKGIVYSFQFIIPKLKGDEYYRKKLIELTKQSSSKEGEYVGCVIWYNLIKEIFRTELFNERILMKFEDEKFWAPKEFDTILKQNFGDYWKYPPEEQRKPHHDYIIVKKGN